MKEAKISHSPKGVLTFPLSHSVLFRHSPKKAHMPSVRPEMTIWGVKGGSPPDFFWAKSYFFGYLERHANIVFAKGGAQLTYP